MYFGKKKRHNFLTEFILSSFMAASFFLPATGYSQALERPPIAMPGVSGSQNLNTPILNSGLNATGMPEAWPDKASKTVMARALTSLECSVYPQTEADLLRRADMTMAEGRSVLLAMEAEGLVMSYPSMKRITLVGCIPVPTEKSGSTISPLGG